MWMAGFVISRTNKNTIVLILIACAVVVLYSCSESTGPNEGFNLVFPDSNVSFSEHVGALFNARCTGPCHAGGAPEAGLNLTSPSYGSIMNHIPRLVTAGQSNNSLLIQRLDGRIQPQMPFNSTPITSNQLNGIKKWIDEGALNN